jgi:hypothetical protein
MEEIKMVEQLEDMSVLEVMRELADISKDLSEIMSNGHWQTSAFLIDNLPATIDKSILYATLYTQMLGATEDSSMTSLQKQHLAKLANMYKERSNYFEPPEED